MKDPPVLFLQADRIDGVRDKFLAVFRLAFPESGGRKYSPPSSLKDQIGVMDRFFLSLLTGPSGPF